MNHRVLSVSEPTDLIVELAEHDDKLVRVRIQTGNADVATSILLSRGEAEWLRDALADKIATMPSREEEPDPPSGWSSASGKV